MTESSRTGAKLATVELFGMPRVIAGTDRVVTAGDSLRGVLGSLVASNPALGDHVLRADRDWLNAGYTFVVDGRFVDDPDTPVSAESEVLLVSRASGG